MSDVLLRSGNCNSCLARHYPASSQGPPVTSQPPVRAKSVVSEDRRGQTRTERGQLQISLQVIKRVKHKSDLPNLYILGINSKYQYRIYSIKYSTRALLLLSTWHAALQVLGCHQSVEIIYRLHLFQISIGNTNICHISIYAVILFKY